MKDPILYASGESTRQLELFPVCGFALLCLGHLLIGHDGLPAVEPTRRQARARLRRCARGESAWTVGYTRAVPVEVHETADEAPLYLIGGG